MNTVDASSEATLRPRRLSDIIGQQHIKDSLKVFLSAADKRGDAIDHILLRGRPGLGKTTFGLAIIEEMDAGVTHMTGPALDAITLRDLVETHLDPSRSSLIQRLRRDVANAQHKHHTLFVDEVHAVPRETFEMLYPLMEDYTFDGAPVPKFTLIGATTDAGKLPPAFRDRFGITYMIDYYPDEDIMEIVKRAFAILAGTSAKLDDAATMAIADRARGTPRIANRLLKRCIDYMAVEDASTLTVDLVVDTMKVLGIDRLGLEESDRNMLVAMVYRFDRPVGLAAIAAAIGEDAKTLEVINEPWLVREGFINRGQRGRTVTARGRILAELAHDGEVPY